MFGVIDETLKPRKPQIFLAKPNRQVIGKLNYFIHGVRHDINLGSLNEISFLMPYEVEREIKHELVRNPYIDNILERFLLKVKLGNDEEWFIINNIEDDMSETSDSKSVHAFSLGYELADKIIRDYNVESYSLWTVVNETIKGTKWTIGEIDPIFEMKFRSFEVSEDTALNFIYKIGETFGALVQFDTINRKINFVDPAKVGQRRGYTIGYGKYLKTLGKSSNSDEMVTRLYVYGKDGLSINRVNPAGSSYLEDFSYFMYPFERDENRNVIKSSRYGMSDEICHAILDYNEMLKSKQFIFDDLLEESEQLEIQLTNKQNEITELQNELISIQEELDLQRSQESFYYHENTYENQNETLSYNLDSSKNYAVMVKIDDPLLKLKINGSSVYTQPNKKWYITRKISNQNSITFEISGTGTIQMYLAEITEEDYNSTDSETIIQKYNEHKKLEEINLKQDEYDEINLQLVDIENQIEDFREEISIENIFTPELLEERKSYIIEKTLTDSNLENDEELLEESKKKFIELRMPKTTLEFNIINFLEVLEESDKWDKLVIGDEIRIRYDKIKIDVRAKITNISFDYDGQTINLTITNIKDLFGEASRILEMLKNSYSTSISFDMSKHKYNEAVEKALYANEKINNAYNAVEQRIIAGAKESVEISNRGIIIRNPDFPNEIILLNSGVISLSRDGGLNWQTALTPNFIVAEVIMGRLLVGENLEISDEEGTFLIKGNLLTIKDRQNIVRLLLGEYEDNKFGLKLMNKTGKDVIIDENGMLQTWQEGRADNVDKNNGLALYVYLPKDTLSIRQAKLRFKLLPFRSYSGTTESAPAQTKTSSSGGGTTTTTASGGGTSKSTESGGSTTRTSSGGGDHRHVMFEYVEDAGTASAPRRMMSAYGSGSTVYLEASLGKELVTASSSGHHTHTVNIPAHTHSFSVPNHTHSITLQHHTHTVEIPAHNHEIKHGIYTSTTATDVGIIINGIDRTSALGGKFNSDKDDIDIKEYLKIGAWNEIVLTSSRLGRIDCNIFVQTFMGV